MAYAILDEFDGHLGIHILEAKGIIPGTHFGSSVLSHIGLDVSIDALVERTYKVVSGLVLGKGLGLPVVQLNLLSHFEKKIDVVGAHSPTQMAETCRQCTSILGKLVKKHLPDQCPLLRASYCGLCASYGHSPANCPDEITQVYREPQFVEQLVPGVLLEQYGIQTRTVLPEFTAAVLTATERILEIPETDDGLRAALMAAGVKPMICQEKGKKENKELVENKKRMQKVADKAGVKLVFIPNK